MPTGLRLLTRGSWPESQRFAEILRKETVGGVLLLVAAGARADMGELAVVSTYKRSRSSRSAPNRCICT